MIGFIYSLYYINQINIIYYRYILYSSGLVACLLPSRWWPGTTCSLRSDYRTWCLSFMNIFNGVLGPKDMCRMNIYVRVSIDLRFQFLQLKFPFLTCRHIDHPRHQSPSQRSRLKCYQSQKLQWRHHESEQQNLRHNDNDVDNDDGGHNDHDNHQQGCSSPMWSQCCTSSTSLLDSRKRQSTACCIFDDKH